MTGGLRKATGADLPQVTEIYTAVCRAVGQLRPNPCGWQEGLYPTPQVAEAALAQNTLYLWEDEAGQAVATVILNQDQPVEYQEADWEIPARDDQVMVVHTFMVHPAHAGKGYGEAVLEEARQMAEAQGMSCLRLDTAELNLPAQRLYQRLGYRLCGMVDLHLGYSEYKWFHCYEQAVRAVPASSSEGVGR